MADEKQLQKDVLFTVAYFASHDYPLTAFELWKNLFRRGEKTEKAGFDEVLKVLESEPLKSKIVRKNGFIALKKEEKLIQRRLKKQKFSLSSIRKIRKWAKLLSAIPYVRGIFLTGTLSMKNAESQSDWDIFVVLAKNRIWAGRFFLAIFLQLAGKRRHGNKIKGRFCLNHYVTESGLILEEHNEFCSNFVSFSFPVLNERLHRRYLALNEQWIRTLKPNYSKEEVPNKTLAIDAGIFLRARIFFELLLERTGLGNALNGLFKKRMIERIKNNPETHLKGADIRYGDSALVFLPRPHRVEVWQKTLQKLTNCR